MPDGRRLGADVIRRDHGGRQLDGTVSAIRALPDIATAVGGRCDILLDSGVRRGTDILKARALGASGVMIGRAYVWGLAAAGEPGVDKAIALLRAELETAMMLLGETELGDLEPDMLISAGAP
ncbi:MAG: alpha-hydroxy acid oxidase [Paracoccaceae bacterium]